MLSRRRCEYVQMGRRFATNMIQTTVSGHEKASQRFLKRLTQTPLRQIMKRCKSQSCWKGRNGFYYQIFSGSKSWFEALAATKQTYIIGSNGSDTICNFATQMSQPACRIGCTVKSQSLIFVAQLHYVDRLKVDNKECLCMLKLGWISPLRALFEHLCKEAINQMCHLK